MDNLLERLQENRKLLLAGMSAILFLLIMIIILLITFSASSSKKPQRRVPGEKFISIDPNALWLSEEPLPLPGIQFSRKQRKKWQLDEVRFWYAKPSKKAMNKLHKENKKIVNKLLEAAP